AGAMLLGATNGQLRLIERFAGCFADHRAADLVEHTVPGLVGQRVFGIALGYEDLIDHDQLRHDPVMAVLGGKLAAKRADCAALRVWCENNGVDFLCGLAKNRRLVAEIEAELAQAAEQCRQTAKPARRFKDFIWQTRKSWSRARRVVAKAEWTADEANPRFIVTSLAREEHEARHLYEELYCARGEMENRIKECQ